MGPAVTAVVAGQVQLLFGSVAGTESFIKDGRLRGLAYMQIDLRGTKSDLHSGVFGGAVANPAMVLSQMLAQMKEREEKVKPKVSFEVGETVKVGFMTLRVMAGPIATPGNYHADEYAMESLNGSRFYRFTPHAGCFRVESREAAINGEANY